MSSVSCCNCGICLLSFFARLRPLQSDSQESPFEIEIGVRLHRHRNAEGPKERASRDLRMREEAWTGWRPPEARHDDQSVHHLDAEIGTIHARHRELDH